MDESKKRQKRIEVSYGLPERQAIIAVMADASATIEQVVRLSGIEKQFVEIDLDTLDTGIFGKAQKLDTIPRDGDRIEVYRPLKADPKEVRRRLAAEGKTMGKKRPASD